MNRFAIIVLFVFLSGAGAAEPLVVRSGEHGTFTRLVLQSSDLPGWRLVSSGQRAEIRFDDPDLELDLATVFSRIPRDRLRRAEQSGPGQPLRLDLACPCPVRAYMEGETVLVIDIVDPGPGTRSPTGEPPEMRRARLFAASGPRLTYAGLPSRDERQVSGFSPPTGPSRPSPPAIVSADPDFLEVARLARSHRAVNLSERRLLEQIGRAATQGLLTVRQELAPQAKIDPPEEEDTAIPGASGSQPPPPVQLRAVTSIDRDMRVVVDNLPDSVDSGRCLNPDVVDVASWGDGRSFAEQIGEHRRILSGEFDDIPPERLGALARTYLHFGFGAEAGGILDLIQDPLPGHVILRTIAKIMDSEPVGQPNPFASQVHCDGEVALWSLLSGGNGTASKVNAAAVIRAFERLPRHLQDLVAPRLTRTFTDMGDVASAELVFRAATRTGTPNGSDMQLAHATLQGLRGEAEAARKKIEVVALSGNEESPEALIAIAETAWVDRTAIPPHVIGLIASYAVEHRKTPHGQSLRLAKARGLALNGDFDAAFAELAEIEKRDGPGPARLAEQDVLTLLAERADNLTFLRRAMPYIDSQATALPSDLAMSLVRRFLETGFPEEAARLLRRTRPDAKTEQSRLLRAELALALDRPQSALLDLLGLEGSAADRLRANALMRTGDYAAAAGLFEKIGDTEKASRALWLAGQWRDIPEGVETQAARKAMIAAELTETAVPPAVETPLARARALLDSSASLRSGIAALVD